jgi:hypothetical protein
MRDTIDMAREAGVKHDIDGVWCDVCELKVFEALVRADEREACAKVCSEWSDYTKGIAPTLAERIRARGNT